MVYTENEFVRLPGDLQRKDPDMVKVVRCKDCKYSWEYLRGRCCSYGVCVDCTVQDDFYCAYAIRKER